MTDKTPRSWEAKLAWAEQKLEELNREMFWFHETNPYEVVNEFDDETAMHEFRFKVRQRPTLPISLLIGDIVHNLRSSLDHLTWALAPDPLPEGYRERDIEFPIYDTPEGYRANRNRRIGCLPDGAKSFIDSLYPDGRPDQGLVMLRDLDIWDKHRRINLLFGSMEGVWFVHTGTVNDYEVGRKIGPISDDEVVLSLPAAIYAQVAKDIEFHFAVTFEQTGPGRGAPPEIFLPKMHSVIRDNILPGLVSFLPNS